MSTPVSAFEGTARKTWTVRAKTFFGIREALLQKGFKPGTAEYKNEYHKMWRALNQEKNSENQKRYYGKNRRRIIKRVTITNKLRKQKCLE